MSSPLSNALFIFSFGLKKISNLNEEGYQKQTRHTSRLGCSCTTLCVWGDLYCYYFFKDAYYHVEDFFYYPQNCTRKTDFW